MMFEDEIFKDDDGTLIQEISCFKCSKKFYLPYKEYKNKLQEIASKRNAPRT